MLNYTLINTKIDDLTKSYVATYNTTLKGRSVLRQN